LYRGRSRKEVLLYFYLLLLASALLEWEVLDAELVDILPQEGALPEVDHDPEVKGLQHQPAIGAPAYEHIGDAGICRVENSASIPNHVPHRRSAYRGER